jgi:hypothetical protein
LYLYKQLTKFLFITFFSNPGSPLTNPKHSFCSTIRVGLKSKCIHPLKDRKFFLVSPASYKIGMWLGRRLFNVVVEDRPKKERASRKVSPTDYVDRIRATGVG